MVIVILTAAIVWLSLALSLSILLGIIAVVQWVRVGEYPRKGGVPIVLQRGLWYVFGGDWISSRAKYTQHYIRPSIFKLFRARYFTRRHHIVGVIERRPNVSQTCAR